MSLGCSYFGVRIPRHAARDLEALAALGYTGVLHTFSENDLAHYRGTMAEIVAASHAAGLEVQASPWGLGGTFGGEAESAFVARRPDACQVQGDGARVAAACLNHPDYRAFCRGWADAAVEAGVDLVFWDEPHWSAPVCRCACCARRFREQTGEELPPDPTPATESFREASLRDFLGELVAHVAAAGGRSTICLLPLVDGARGVSDWDAVASLPGLDTLATDPYWKVFGEPAAPFVDRFARLLAGTAARHGLRAQLWVPSFGLTAADVPDLEAAVDAAQAAGVEDLWTWGFEACAHMSSLATPDAPVVWSAVTRALVGEHALPPAERTPELRELDLLPVLDLVQLLNDEDAGVPAAVRRAAPALAGAIEAIVERLERGGRLVYVGAGTSGRLAQVDAAECGPTFGVAPDRVTAVVAVAQQELEDDEAAGTAEIAAASVGPDDAVVAISASGSTPYVVAAARAAAAAGALTVGVVCSTGSELGRVVDREVLVEVGPEVVAGSTRLKAGTAQKLVLNTISTVSMVKLGHTYGNLMIGVVADNAKLRARVRRALAVATGAAEPDVEAVLAAAGGDARVALVSLLAGLEPPAARERLDRAGGVVRRAL